MPDREKVIKALECCGTRYYGDIVLKCYECLYGNGPASDCRYNLHQDAIALLKEQETKTGKWIPIESPTGVEAFGAKEMTVMNVRCSVCGSEEDVSFTGYKYCPRCGAKMEGR